MTPTAEQPTTIVLMPGLWLTALSWEHWVELLKIPGGQR